MMKMVIQLYFKKNVFILVKRINDSFSPILINISHKNVFLNQTNVEITRSGVIDPETIYLHVFCYQCYKHGPDCVFSILRVKVFSDEPHFPIKNN